MITVEDINSVLMKNKSHGYIEIIDTENIGTHEFSNVKYDFCIISHSINDNEHTFTIQVVNSNWSGVYGISGPGHDEIIDHSWDTETKTFTLITTSNHFKFICHCNALSEFNLQSNYYFPLIYEVYAYKNQMPITVHYDYLDVRDMSITRTGETFNDFGRNEIVISDPSVKYPVMIYLLKSDFTFNPNGVCTVGKVNHIALGTDSNYLPNGSMVDSDQLTMEVHYNDMVIPVSYDSTLGDYCFELDLTNKTDLNKVDLILNVYENKYVNQGSFEFKLDCKYLQINNFSDLINNINEGAEIIELATDITLLSRIYVNHDLVIYGNNHMIESRFGVYGFNILQGSHFKAKEVHFRRHNSAIIQSKNTIVDLEDCLFDYNSSTDYNQLGSCIYCDVDIESLYEPTDFITNIKNCSFTENRNTAIFHGGQLNIDNCNAHSLTLVSLTVKENPFFLYQTDGEANIRNSIFDIDTGNQTGFCDGLNYQNIGFAQALIMCGKNAIINGVLGSNLAKDNALPFFEGVFNNRSHVFAFYYYPQIEECVYSSPVKGKEDQCICYGVSGVDWVFKENIQVTRASEGTQNEIRKIEW